MVTDAVVIGAGHNGLVAANLLADAGWDVVVLETADSPGGAVRTGELAAPGYRSDVCSAFFPFAVASPALRRLRLEDHGLVWRRAPAALAHVFPDGTAAVVGGEVGDTAESLGRFAGEDARAWPRLCAQWERVAEPLLEVLLGPFPPLGAAGRLTAATGTAVALRLVRRMLLSSRDLGEELFEGEGARALLTGCAMHGDIPPEGAGSGGFGWLLLMLSQQLGFPAPEGGARAIIDALVRRLRSRGGRVECATRVDRIPVARGRALGAVATDGRSWRARRAVLADLPAETVYRDLLDREWLPWRLLTDVGNIHYGFPVLKLDWALSEPIPWDNQQLSRAGTIHIGGDTARLSRFAAELAAGVLPRTPFMLAGQMGVADPSRCPPGSETAWAYTHLPKRFATVSADDPDVEAYARRMEELLNEYAPGFGGRVVGRHVLAPSDFTRENPNLIGGALETGSVALAQQSMFRPVPGLGRGDTVVDRLYLAGASAHPGPAVHGGPGANAARSALRRDAVVTGAAYRAIIDLGHRLVYRG